MRKWKRLSAAMAVLLALATMLASCGGGGGGTAATTAAATTAAAETTAAAAEATTAAAAAETTAAAAAETTAAAAATGAGDVGYGAPTGDFDEHLKISMTVLDAEKTGKDAKAQWLFEHFNIEWDFIPVTWGDWTEKVRVMVAGDDIPDILWWDMKINHTAEFRTWAEAGAFREIDVSAYPGLTALRESIQSDDAMLMLDGKLYGWSVTRNNPEWLQNAYYPLYAYRRDWAKAIGMYKEGDAYTWDEVFAMLDAVKAQDPGGNGEGNTFGITSEAWAFPGVFMETLGYSKNRDAYVKTDAGYVPYFTTEPFRQELKFVANMYRNGYIWKDMITVGGSEGLDNFKAGRAFMYLGNNSPDWFNGQYSSWLESGSIKSTDDLAPMMIYSPADGKTFTLTATEDYWTVAHFAHDLSDAKYKRILDMWEWLESEDGRAFRLAGIPGVDYEREAGSPTFTVLWGKTADGLWDSPYKDIATNYMTPPSLVAGPNETTVQTGWDAFEDIIDFMQNSPDYYVTPLNWAMQTFNGELFSQYGGFSTESREFIINVYASTEDVDAMLDKWLAEMEPKWRPVADELNAQFTP